MFSFFNKDSSFFPFIYSELYKSVIFAQKFTIITHNNIPDFISQEEFNILLESYVDSHNHCIDKLIYNFVSKEKMFELNKEFLNHDTNTDIITFDYSNNKTLRAEFFVSLWAISLSAEELSQSLENETIRVMIHGVLHCLGYTDASSSDKKQMRRLEDQFLNMFHVKRQNHV